MEYSGDLDNVSRKDGNSSNYKPYSELAFSFPELVCIVAFLSILILTTIVLNSITFIVIKRMDRKKFPFQIFILSLCLSDILSACSSPFTVYGIFKAYDDYRIPEAFCKIGLPTDIWTTSSTSLHILMMCTLRLAALKWPFKFKNVLSPKLAKIIVTTVWTATFLMTFVPISTMLGVLQIPESDPVRYQCTNRKDIGNALFIYTMVAFPVLVLLPTLLIFVASIALVLVILQKKASNVTISRENQRAKSDNAAVLQLGLIVLSYFVGYLPEAALRVMVVSYDFRRIETPYESRIKWNIMAHFFLRVSECMNPVFYNLAASNLRSATIDFLRGILPCSNKSASATGGASTNSKDGKSVATQVTNVERKDVV